MKYAPYHPNDSPRVLMVLRNTQNRGFVPYFETIIRYLGGLLSAYALSKDEILLRRAEELADTLDPVFNTPSGLPAFSYEPVRSVQNIPFFVGR